MSSFTMVLLEDGMEMELPTDLTNVITILDQEVPHFQFEGHTYKVSAGKATLGTRWDLLVESIDMRSRDQSSFKVGRIELEKLDNRMVQFRIPPRHEQEETRDKDKDRDTRCPHVRVSRPAGLSGDSARPRLSRVEPGRL